MFLELVSHLQMTVVLCSLLKLTQFVILSQEEAVRRGVYSPQDLYTFPATRVGESSTLKVNIRNNSSDMHEVRHDLFSWRHWKNFFFSLIYCSRNWNTECKYASLSIKSRKCMKGGFERSLSLVLVASGDETLLSQTWGKCIKKRKNVLFSNWRYELILCILLFHIANRNCMTDLIYLYWMINVITPNSCHCALHGVDIWCVASLIDLQLTFVNPREPFHIKHSKYSLRWVCTLNGRWVTHRESEVFNECPSVSVYVLQCLN